MTYSGTERSIVSLMNCWLGPLSLEMPARAARIYQCSNVINTLCTAFWDPSRAIHTLRCSQHSEPFALILDWKVKYWFCRGSCWRVCDLGGSQFSWILERCYSAQRNVVVLGIQKHHWLMTQIVMIKNMSLRSLRKGRFSFILHIDHIMRDIKSPWSLTNWI